MNRDQLVQVVSADARRKSWILSAENQQRLINGLIVRIDSR